MKPSYLNHLAGLASLLTWVGRWEALSSPVRIQGPYIRLGLLASQRFALGRSRINWEDSHPFLGVQPDERAWMGRLTWNRAVHVPSENRLVLISQAHSGTTTDRVDLPAFAVVLETDEPLLLQAASVTGKLEARALWFDDANEVQVAGGRPLWSLKIHEAPSVQGVFSEDEIQNRTSFADLMRIRIEHTNRPLDPGYKGPATAVDPAFRHMVDPFRPDQVPPVRAD